MTEQWQQRNRHWETMFVQIGWLLYQSNFQGGQRMQVEQFFITKAPAAAAPAPRRSIALELEAWARVRK
jgi:hypothetical protein